MRELKAIDVAMGRQPADLVIRGGRLVNVLTREIYPADVAVAGTRIAAVGNVDYTMGPDTAVVDASSKYLTPGLIDQHIHIHETQLDIVQFAAAVLPRGTTGVCTGLGRGTWPSAEGVVHARDSRVLPERSLWPLRLAEP